MNVKIISRYIGARLGFSNIFTGRSYASGVKSVKSTQETESGLLEYDEVPIFKEEEESVEKINILRNKSRLDPAHRNILHDKRPYEISQHWIHDTVKYKRKMLGRYGLSALDAPAGIAWPTREQVKDMQEYERVAYPVPIQSAWAQIEKKKQEDEKEIMLRQELILKKLQNMETWKKELKAKIEKKAATERAAKEKKEKMMEEIRRHFGINIDPRSPKFKELLEKKELEDKKMKKSMKKEEKAAKLIEKINRKLEFTEKDSKEKKEAKPSKEVKKEKTPKKENKEVSSNDEKPKDQNPV